MRVKRRINPQPCKKKLLFFSQSPLRVLDAFSPSRIRKFTAAGLLFSGFFCFSTLAARESVSPRTPEVKNLGDARLSFDYESAKTDLQLSESTKKRADALAWFIQGLLEEEDGNNDQSLDAFERVLELDPTGVDAKLAVRIATEYIRRGDTPRGLKLLKETAAAQPREPLPLVTLAFVYLQELNQPDVALRYARESVKIAPYDLRSHQALYSVFEVREEWSAAEKAIDQAANLDTKNAEFWFGIGEMYLRFFSRERAEDQIDLLKIQKITRTFEKALAIAPQDASVQARVGDYYLRIGDLQKAVPLYEKAITSTAPGRENLEADIREKLARIYYNLGKIPEAIAMLQSLVKLNPLRSEAYLLLGEIYERQKNYESALMNFEQALLTGRTDPRNYLRVAHMALRTKKFDKAISVLIDARARFGSPEFTSLLGYAYSMNGQHTEAIAKFEETLAESTNYEGQTLNAGFYLSYADAAQKAGLVEKTVELIRKSIEIDPSNAHEGQNFLGYFWIDRNENLEEAAQLVRQALLVEPKNGAYLDSLGWYYYRIERYDLALKYLLRSLEALEEPDAVVIDHLGDTYQKLGNLEAALENWQKALVLDPQNKIIAEKIRTNEK